ncbi:FAD-dependent oxidoreductase [Jannaschia sp. S6380]|uniref:FAD-dependent oxidoreductase n=1 Tax=Jannaschia sp. S6380 TaxID=2926408 RepID=UPI001FF2567F|nr:FAD-dependent oxidoreductase [Jannaschia sp. S6380]MCK0168482.1 FAD-dependent oxidoreductase [Jannaschia sp. S6380]
MKRATLAELTADPVDILVIGGGIYGLMAARDAALRGFSTVLVERDDFGGGTSHNSLKIMHGGIRYLQQLDIARLRASARERAFWQRAAPALIRPLDFVIPLFGHAGKGPEAFRAAAALYRIASAGLRGPEYGSGAVITAAAARDRMGELAPAGMTAGGVWQDGQILDANRLHLACLRAGIDAGLRAANHMRVDELCRRDATVTGAQVTDRLTGETGRIRARMTLCCAGVATPDIVATAKAPLRTRFPSFARALNIVTDRPADPQAIGIVSRTPSDSRLGRGGRMYFLTPWQGRTIIGTHEADPTDDGSPQGDVDAFLHELAAAGSALRLGRGNVLWTYVGNIPADIDDARGGPRRHTRGTLVDHGRADGLAGLISVTGVKYTTARLVAERAVDCAAAELGHRVRGRPSLEAGLPDPGLAIFDPSDGAALDHRIRTAIREEMADSLEDVLLRRTTLAETGRLAGPAGAALIDRAAGLMAEAAGWGADRRAAEAARIRDRLPGAG